MLATEGLLQLREFSNRVFTVATGTLALSVTFKSSIGSGSPNFGWLLSVSWVLLTISILAHLWAQLSQGLYFVAAGIGEEKQEKRGHLATLQWALPTAGICFSLGLISLCLFAVLNNT